MYLATWMDVGTLGSFVAGALVAWWVGFRRPYQILLSALLYALTGPLMTHVLEGHAGAAAAAGAPPPHRLTRSETETP